MSDDSPREDGEPLHDDAGTPEHGEAEADPRGDAEERGRGDGGTAENVDAETRGRGDAGKDFGRGDGETGRRGDEQAPESVDAETRGRGDAGNARDADAGTRGRGDAGNVGDVAAETIRRGDAEKTDEAFLASEEGLAGSAEATASDVGEPQAASAVEQAALAESSVDEPPPPAVDRRKAPRGPRPSLAEEREAVFHDEGGYRMRMEPAALAKLRELPGAKGKTDRELGEEFFKGQSARLVASMAGDVETPAEVRVVVDPYSRQAFLAVGRTIRGIVSF